VNYVLNWIYSFTFSFLNYVYFIFIFYFCFNYNKPVKTGFTHKYSADLDQSG